MKILVPLVCRASLYLGGWNEAGGRRHHPTMTREDIHEWALSEDIEIILFDPPEVFDPAIVGIVTGHSQEYAVLYDLAIVRANFVKHGMDEVDVDDWIFTNTLGASIGPHTPRFLLIDPRY